ncbi:hypothetical protein L596_027830 [Steinernema carpocapsae]|uniref:Secreted protein n=1 Tax=Steinernema carpocapsae TaxID=34508 RepID=A0A4U5LWN1_STECR|nr:hypothetical protein L596_027830 [Steinernema carpocapsae]
MSSARLLSVVIFAVVVASAFASGLCHCGPVSFYGNQHGYGTEKAHSDGFSHGEKSNWSNFKYGGHESHENGERFGKSRDEEFGSERSHDGGFAYLTGGMDVVPTVSVDRVMLDSENKSASYPESTGPRALLREAPTRLQNRPVRGDNETRKRINANSSATVTRIRSIRQLASGNFVTHGRTRRYPLFNKGYLQLICLDSTYCLPKRVNAHSATL